LPLDSGDLVSTDNRFQRAIALFDAANAEDPRMDDDHGEAVPRELLYARRMSEMLERFAPEAPEAVKLAVRSQHVQRWKIPRDAYPMDRTGYLRWRTRLYEFHADTAGGLMKAAGYDDEMIQRVQDAVGKKGLKVNPETQMLEDVSALVFLEHYILEFAGHKPDYTEDKWVDILRKTWRKMSEGAHAFVRCGRIQLPGALAPLIEKATT
jgi:hypothetical protein